MVVSAAALRLRDPALQGAFDARGYVVVDLLGPDALATLARVWEQGADPIRHMPFNVTIMSTDCAYRRAVSAAVARAVAAAQAALFEASRFVYGSFVAKTPAGPGAGLVALHQDPSFIDERLGDTCNIWMPLIDVDPSNGCLWVVPGSHRLNRSPRSTAAFFRFPYPALLPAIGALAVPVPLRAGQAILTAQTLFHGSQANLSARTRCAVSAVIAPAGAPLRHYYQPLDDPLAPLEVFAIDPDFFCRHTMNARPDLAPLASIPPRVDPVTLADLARLVA